MSQTSSVLPAGTIRVKSKSAKQEEQQAFPSQFDLFQVLAAAASKLPPKRSNRDRQSATVEATT
jgi:hypothetical protein